MFELADTSCRMILTVWMWAFRYIHVALDTLVLYGALREKNIDGRAAGSDGIISGISVGRSGGSNHKVRPVATTSSV